MDKQSRIFVAGHRGLVGGAIVRRLQAQGFDNLLLAGRDRLDLTDQAAVESFFQAERPEYVVLAAAKVGGIHANDAYPAEFIRDNLAIQTNVIHSAWRAGVKKLCFLGSSCIYPKLAPQPMPESCLLTGPLEPTNEWYAIAKIASFGDRPLVSSLTCRPNPLTRRRKGSNSESRVGSPPETTTPSMKEARCCSSSSRASQG